MFIKTIERVIRTDWMALRGMLEVECMSWFPDIGIKPYFYDDDVVIFNADCREVLPLLEPGSVDLVLTDPPYSSGARRDADRQVRGSMLRSMEDSDWFSHDQMTQWGYSWFLNDVLRLMRERLSSGAHVYVFSDWRQTPNVYGMLEATGFWVNNCLVWNKMHFGMGVYWRNQHENIIFASLGQPKEMVDKGKGTVISISGVSPLSRIHPTEKPQQLINTILTGVPGEIILDLFLGSGTTARAAKDMGRKCIGIEIEEKYCEIAANRMAQTVMQL